MGRRVASFSGVESARIPLSWRMAEPFEKIGEISESSCSRWASALAWELAANWSWASRLMPNSRARISAVSPMMRPEKGSVRPSSRPMRGLKSERLKLAAAESFCPEDFARFRSEKCCAASWGKSSGIWVMLSTPPTRKRSPCPAAMRWWAAVIASIPEAQLRCTVTAGTCCGTPERSAITRAMFAASTGWATQPMMTSESSPGSMPVLVSRAEHASRPRSSAVRRARSVPILQNGVRTAAMM